MDHLTDDQQSALAHLLELTGGECEHDVAMSVLESVGWDVQKATEMIFDHPPRPNSPPHIVHAQMEEFEIDDSDQNPLLRPDRPVRGQEAAPLSTLITRPIFSILSFPFSLLSSLFRFVFSVLRIPYPRFTGLTFYSPLARSSLSRGTREWTPERWLRELEEETGAVSLGRLKASKGVTSASEPGPASSSSSSSSSSNNLTSRNKNGALIVDGVNLEEEGKKYLPDFEMCTYEEALRTAQREARVACIFLLSEEHDDTAEFKRSTLTSPTLLHTLHTSHILTWAAPTSSREGWSAAQKLGATSFPFVAFASLQPPRSTHTSNSNSTSPVLTVLSRHQGLEATRADKLADHIENQVLPRVSAYLNRLQNQAKARQMERQLREDQDRAFADAARRDRERIESRAREEREKEEGRRRAVEKAQQVEEERQRAAESARQLEATRMEWRRWTRRALVANSTSSQGDKDGLRIAVRLPNGTRHIHTFAPSATLTDLYAFVDASLIPESMSPTLDPSVPPPSAVSASSSLPIPSNDATAARELLEAQVSSYSTPSEYWNFTLASSFPRAEIPWRAGASLGDVKEVRGGGQVVVEMVSSRPASVASSTRGDDGDGDGYETESDEE